MALPTNNIHGTAILVGKAGLLFVGPSGIGKSSMALQCLATARRAGWTAALVSDDQVLVSRQDERLVARRPDAIAGLLEIRGSGIASIPSIPEADLHLAILLSEPGSAERLPESGETYPLGALGALPQLRLANDHREPLGAIAALHPDIGIPSSL